MAPLFRFFGRPKPAVSEKDLKGQVSPEGVDPQKDMQWLIVGLGNPGRKYAGNRHNAGFHVVDRLAAAANLSFAARRYRTHLAQGRIGGVRVVLVKPQVYMNQSGRAVAPIARFFKVPPERMLVIFDDLDLPLGRLRLRPKGGSGGHQGVTNIIAHLHTRDFPRIRIGIGRPPGRMLPEAYVLQDFERDEKPIMAQAYHEAVEAIHVTLRDGFEMAMNRFNRD